MGYFCEFFTTVRPTAQPYELRTHGQRDLYIMNEAEERRICRGATKRTSQQYRHPSFPRPCSSLREVGSTCPQPAVTRRERRAALVDAHSTHAGCSCLKSHLCAVRRRFAPGYLCDITAHTHCSRRTHAPHLSSIGGSHDKPRAASRPTPLLSRAP